MEGRKLPVQLQAVRVPLHPAKLMSQADPHKPHQMVSKTALTGFSA